MARNGRLVMKNYIGNIELEQVLPKEIEKRSFEIITEELKGRTFPKVLSLLVKRAIHTSCGFDYA